MNTLSQNIQNTDHLNQELSNEILIKYLNELSKALDIFLNTDKVKQNI